MEIYTVDRTKEFRKDKLIENYESILWADRYSAYGEFSIVCKPSTEYLNLLQPDVIIGTSESNRLMQIKSALRTTDEQGKEKLKISGFSTEYIMENRAAKKVLSAAPWELTGTPGNIVYTMVNTICVLGTGINVVDTIPYLAAQDISGSTGSYAISVKAGSLYARIKEICDAFNLGFRITTTPGEFNILFQVYAGVDLSGPGGVVFGKDLDNLAQTSSFRSKANQKTVAYVYSNNGGLMVDSPYEGTSWGWERKVLLVDATDITLPAGAALNAALTQRGRTELAAYPAQTLYDGVTQPTTGSEYLVDYGLGDLVTLKGDDGVPQTMRVTEYIWSFDEGSGRQGYPTLAVVGGV